MKTWLNFRRLFALASLLPILSGARAGAALIPASFTNSAIADAFVASGPDGSLSSSNFGAAGALAVAASGLPNGEFESVLRFNLAGAESAFNAQFGAGQWTILSVMLQLTAAPHNNAIFNTVAAGQFGISLLQNDTWVEGTGTGGIPTADGISLNILNSITSSADQPLGTFDFNGATSGATAFTLNLSPGLLGDVLGGKDVDLTASAVDPATSALFDSRTGGADATFHPELIVNVIPEPGSMALCALGLGTFSLLSYARRLCR